jgi:hypothetical protein
VNHLHLAKRVVGRDHQECLKHAIMPCALDNNTRYKDDETLGKVRSIRAPLKRRGVTERFVQDLVAQNNQQRLTRVRCSTEHRVS